MSELEGVSVGDDDDTRIIEPLSVFPEEHREAVSGLAYLGYIERVFEYCGHSFRLRTLKPAEKAAIGIIMQPWKETLAEPEVWANAHVALSLCAIDGVIDFCEPINNSITDYANSRYEYVTNKDTGLLPPVLDFLFNSYVELENEARSALSEFQNLSQRRLVSSPPSQEASIKQGPSLSEIGLDNPASPSFK